MVGSCRRRRFGCRRRRRCRSPPSFSSSTSSSLLYILIFLFILLVLTPLPLFSPRVHLKLNVNVFCTFLLLILPFPLLSQHHADLSSPSSLFARCVNKIRAALLDCMLLRYPDQDNSHGDRLRMGCWRGTKHTTERANIFIAQDVCGQMCHRTTGDERDTRRHVAYQHGEQFKTAGGNYVATCLGTNGPRCVRLGFLISTSKLPHRCQNTSADNYPTPCLGTLGRVRMLLCCLAEVLSVFSTAAHHRPLEHRPFGCCRPAHCSASKTAPRQPIMPQPTRPRNQSQDCPGKPRDGPRGSQDCPGGFQDGLRGP